jgi:AcrR family transcriptional regulator
VSEPANPRDVPIWARSKKERRPALTREVIVDAAVKIADAEGLAGVSIRRVAADLGARTMSLYSHIDSKDDLFDLMREQVMAEVFVETELPADWREAARAIARREHEVSLRHPWLVHLIGHPGHAGPNAMRHLEQSLSAIEPVTSDIEVALRIMIAIDEYVIGHVIYEVTKQPAATLTQPYLRTVVEEGDFPRLRPLLADGVPPLEGTFERGLDWLLDGIAAEFG